MKKINILAMFIAVFAFCSCSDDDDTPQLTSTVAPVLRDLAVTTIAPDNVNSAYTFNWEAPRFYMDGNESPTGVGSFEQQGINYDLQVDFAGGDFSAAASVGQVVKSTYLAVTYADLTRVLKNQLGLADDAESADLIFRIVATYSSSTSLQLVSNTIQAQWVKAEEGEEPEPDDGYEPDFDDGLTHKIYVQLNNGWTDLSIYAWNEGEGMLGWPGVHHSGTVNIGGKDWYVFDMPSGYQHTPGLNYIFNDNGQGNQFDAMSDFTFGHDLFITIDENNQYTIHAGPIIAEGGFTVYTCISEAGWDGVWFYNWGGPGELAGGWPGAAGQGPIEINGKQWYYNTFMTDEDINVIINNNAGVQAPDITGHRDIYVTVGASGDILSTTSGLYK